MQGFNRGYPKLGTALYRLAFDITLASDGGVDRMEKAEVLSQPSVKSHHLYRPYPVSDDGFNRKRITQSFQAMPHAFHNGLVGVRNTQYDIAVRAFRNKDARQKPLAPVVGRSTRPGNNL